MSSPSDADFGLPEVYERLVTPETPYEMHDGKLVRVSPSDPAHATFHAKLIALLEAHVANGFMVAIDMLTRTSQIDDIAPDASVFPQEPDPRTGRRQLEQLAFEIVSTQSMGNAAKKAAKLAGRGVRRVFAIDVERECVHEWSRELASWSVLGADSSIEDLVLAVPLPIAALVHVSKTDDAVAAALVARRNPVIEAVRLEGRKEGRKEGQKQGREEGQKQGREEGQREGREEGQKEGRARARVEVLLAVLASWGLQAQPDELERILLERDLDRLDRWIARVALCSSVAELLAT